MAGMGQKGPYSCLRRCQRLEKLESSLFELGSLALLASLHLQMTLFYSSFKIVAWIFSCGMVGELRNHVDLVPRSSQSSKIFIVFKRQVKKTSKRIINTCFLLLFIFFLFFFFFK